MAKNGLNYDQITDILNNRDKEENKDRRQKRDLVTRMSTILSLGAWVIMIAVWIVLDQASPEKGMRFTQTFFEVHFGVDSAVAMRTRWNYTLVYAAYVMMLISLGSCAIAFVLNKMRMKRKNDKLKISIFVISGITVIAFVFFLIQFWSVLF